MYWYLCNVQHAYCIPYIKHWRNEIPTETISNTSKYNDSYFPDEKAPEFLDMLHYMKQKQKLLFISCCHLLHTYLKSLLLSTLWGLKKNTYKLCSTLYEHMNLHSESKTTLLSKGGMECAVATELNKRKYSKFLKCVPPGK